MMHIEAKYVVAGFSPRSVETKNGGLDVHERGLKPATTYLNPSVGVQSGPWISVHGPFLSNTRLRQGRIEACELITRRLHGSRERTDSIWKELRWTGIQRIAVDVQRQDYVSRHIAIRTGHP